MVGGVLVFVIVSFVKPSLVSLNTILSPKNTTWKNTWENDKQDMTSLVKGLKKNQVYLYDNNIKHFQNLVLFIVQ